MLPFFVLVIGTLVLKALGAAGLHPLNHWTLCLRGGLALMFRAWKWIALAQAFNTLDDAVGNFLGIQRDRVMVPFRP